MASYITSVGMEVHAELMTGTKMFCRCPVGFGNEPNTCTCPVCLGLPGALPIPNQAAIEMVIKTALALNCTIAMHSIFHRKNYFYPDLAKGFQTSQYGDTNPIGYNGYLEIPAANGGTKRIRIRRVHLEEDTGKLNHLSSGASGIDYNRAGTPLMEIVTDFPPDIQSPDEAKEYLVQLRQLLIYLGVCDGRMEHGSLRCEPNVSVRPEGSVAYGTKTEIKNLSSFRAVQLGIGFEVRRQIAAYEQGEPVLQETRGWSEDREATFPMRVKEAENDYRYFPCPDLVPMDFSEATIEAIRSGLPELPVNKLLRYQETLGLSAYDAQLLIADKPWAEWFEEAIRLGGEPKAICNWMNSDFAKMLNETGQTLAGSKITPKHLVELTQLVAGGTINGKTAKAIFEQAFETGQMPKALVEASGATQISDTDAIRAVVQQVVAGHPDVVEKYKSGQQSVKGFFVGQIMKQTQGRANPGIVQQLLDEALTKV